MIPTDARCVAVVCPTWVGDTVMATPVFRALRAHRPDTRLVAVTRPHLDQLLAGAPWVDHVLAISPRGLLGPWRAGRVIARVDPDAVLLLPNSFRAGLVARCSGAPARIGYRRDRRDRLLTHAVEVVRSDTPTSTVSYYAHLVAAALGVHEVDERLELAVTAEETQAAEALLEPLGERPFLLLNPGANRGDKRWPAASFAEAASRLARDRELAVAVTGAPAEADVVREVVTHLDAPVRSASLDLVAGGVTLGALKAVVRAARVFITNDTGPRHIAAALGTPVVSLFGPTDWRWTRLEAARERVVRSEPFLPEEMVADRHARLCAIDRISVGDVVDAAASLLDASG